MFSELPGRPSPNEMIEPPRRRPGYTRIIVPPLRFFEEEFNFWTKMFRKSDRAGDVTGRSIAEAMRSELCVAGDGLVRIGEMQIGARAMDRTYLGKWHTTSALVMSFSALWREAFPDVVVNGEGNITFDAATLSICADLNTTRPDKSGIHFKQGVLEEVGINWPETENHDTWYEGERIYATVRRPAKPTQPFMQNYSNAYPNQPQFPAAEYATILPRIKRDVWDQQA